MVAFFFFADLKRKLNQIFWSFFYFEEDEKRKDVELLNLLMKLKEFVKE